MKQYFVRITHKIEFMDVVNATTEFTNKLLEDDWAKVHAVEFRFLKIAQWFK